MNKFSRTARSVTFAAIVGLSMGVSAPAAIAQDTAVNQAAGNSPLVNKDAKGSLTIHKFGNPTSEGQPSGTEADVQDVIANGGEKLAGVGFTVYKINKTADGATPHRCHHQRGSAGCFEAEGWRVRYWYPGDSGSD